MTFNELGLRPEVLQALENMNFTTPTPIQEKAIPHLLSGESDFVGLAQTGTGKTAAFGLPLLSIIDWSNKFPQGIIICPTRELCLQIAKDLAAFGKYLQPDTVVAVYGGADIRRQITQIKKGANIIVATPGRLVDLINRKAIDLNRIETVVLDEADEMLNMGFKEDIDMILNQTPDYKNVWLFSATMPKEVAQIAKNYMLDPLEVSIGHKNQSNENIDHIYYVVKERDRYLALKRLIDVNPEIFGLVFCRTRRETQDVAEKLGKEGYSAEPLHGDLSQAQRDRVMDRFRRRDLQLLVATDVAARGIDVDNISHVINYNLPDDIENYTHRSGRTARAGRKGESLVLINPKEKFKIKAIEKQMRTTFTLGEIPSTEQVFQTQLNSIVQKVVAAPLRHEELDEFMPQIIEMFEGHSKEEVIQQFVSAEFARFLEFYRNASDLNAKASRDDNGGERRERGRRRESDGNAQRYFVNLGRKDGLNPGGLLRVICDETGLNSSDIGRIDIKEAFSFFETKPELANLILDASRRAEFEGKSLNVELTKDSGGGRSGGRSRGGSSSSSGGRRSGGSKFGSKGSSSKSGGFKGKRSSKKSY
ncbi:DEAD/DEAH box helicase [Wandonia haliotis]|uniref:RNA helicase n=1 Tax=Wandonia haliotis TaxID=574963 RepID=A0ABN1MPR4_9FLAO